VCLCSAYDLAAQTPVLAGLVRNLLRPGEECLPAPQPSFALTPLRREKEEIHN